MTICVDCRRSSLTVECRQGDEMLCKSCDDKRTEHQPRTLRSSLNKSDTSDNETVPPIHTADSPKSVSNTANQDATATKQSLTPPKAVVEPSNNFHCHEHCKFGRSDQGDMIRCCLSFRWFHEGCVDSIDKETPW